MKIEAQLRGDSITDFTYKLIQIYGIKVSLKISRHAQLIIRISFRFTPSVFSDLLALSLHEIVLKDKNKKMVAPFDRGISTKKEIGF